MKTKIIIPSLVVVLVASVAFKLSNNKRVVEEKVYKPDTGKKTLVKTDTVTYHTLAKDYTYSGNFSALREVMIIPQAAGQIKGVYFQEGEIVNVNKTLVQIDDELLMTQLIAAEANFET